MRTRGLPSSAQRGLTIVEFMIAIALGFIIIAAMLTIFANSSRARQEMQKATQQKESGRFASQLIADNVAMAGFLGEFDPTAMTLPAALPDPCATDQTDLIDALPLHVQGVDDATSASAPSCISDLKSGTDILVIRRAGECAVNGIAGANGAPGCESYNAARYYFQASLCNDASELALLPNANAGYASSHFALAKEASSLTRRRMECVAGQWAPVRRYHTHIYFVANNNEPGDGIPTLKRWELGVGIVSLVDGIENLQVEYGVDTNGDGAPDAWTPAPADIIAWRNVMAARVHVLARNTQPTGGYIDDRSYTLGRDADGDPKNIGPFNDAYKRHVYVTTTRMTNPSWRRQ